MREKRPSKISARVPFLAVVVSLLTTAGGLYAFQSTQIQSVSCGVFVGGTKPSPEAPSGGLVFIHHSPLAGVSPVTKVVIIQGEAGGNLNNFVLKFSQRVTAPGGNGPIRVHLEYRFVSPNTPPDSISQPVTLTPFLRGNDPMGFAFQIPASSINNSFLQYRIIVDRVDGNGVVIASVTYPPPVSSVSGQALTISSIAGQWVSVGIIANEAQAFDSHGGRVILHDGNPNDGETELDIPAGVLSEPTTISMDEVDPGSPIIPPGLSQAVAVYRLDADHPIHGSFQVSLLYQDFVFPSGQRGVINGTDISENQASIVWYDGFAWRRLGGVVNALLNTVTTRISSLNYLAVVTAGPLAPEDRRPLEKILTPNGDGKNDTILFALDGGRVEIFDVGGHRIRTLFSTTNPEWDGRDDSGRIVESGVYIYQYEADGKRVSGVVAVAK